MTVVRAHRAAVHVMMAVVSSVSRMTHVPRWHTVHHLTAHRIWWRHPLLLLPPIAEPNPHHLLLELQGVRERGDLLR